VCFGRSHDSLPRFHPRSQVANELRDALTNVAVLGNHVLVQDQVRMPHLIMPRRARLLVAVVHDHFLPQPPTTDDGFCKMAGRQVAITTKRSSVWLRPLAVRVWLTCFATSACCAMVSCSR
jgi:hypothetical protein